MLHVEPQDELALRLADPEYAVPLFDLIDRNRHYLREWLPWVDGTHNAEYSRMFLEACVRQYTANNGFQCCIFYRGELAGCIGLHAVDWANKKTSIGYWLAPDYTGKGIMTRSCRAVVNHLFDELKLNRVEIRAGIHNGKSRAIPERLGFKLEGIVRQAEWLYDHYTDHALYGMLAEDWTGSGSILEPWETYIVR